MLIETYCTRSGLATSLVGATKMNASAEAVQTHRVALQALLTTDALAKAVVHWSFRVPELGDAGACSLFGQLAAEPYDLARTLGGRTASSQRLLAVATLVVQYYRQHSRSQWFGIYQAHRNTAGQRVLVKLAYFGAESRAEFPLTEEFAKGSNNSAVGLSGHARLINDVAAYVAEGGGYYTCDPKVKAEACLPLFDEAGQVVGIIDSEASDRDFFAGEELALVIAVALTLCGAALAPDAPADTSPHALERTASGA